MPVVELVSFPASDAYLQDQSALKPYLDMVGKKDGLISMYYGLKHEDKTTGIYSILWESYEHHKKILEDPNYISQAWEALAPALARQSFVMHHILVDIDTAAAFTASVTDITYLKRKEGKDQTALENLQEYVELLSTAEGVHPPPIWGETAENADEYLLIIGRESAEDNFGAVVEEGQARKVQETFDIKVEHVKFVKHV